MDTANELLAKVRENNPDHQFTVNRQGNAVAVFNESLSRYQAWASLGLDGLWYAVGTELMANGVPIWKQTDWLDLP